jgi:hypothetical protein|nr:MAG: hypothetical protein [Bacteriophage sp.]DAW11943.1 MAG TPA: hypothetical protein [Caudoviricetes sp.]UVY51549.1 MAG: hypothetical protein [Bacteriophage sp.]UWD62257.1 MAG: hypothetical protein [Bacteriophage sp.]UWD69251.1 MAG: hypothetical protein [Bacteriophage sp.]
MIELRSYNVERIWHETAICTIGNEVGVHKEILEKNAPAIREMVSQIETDKDGNVPFMFCNHRKDGELWTPYLQIVEMLIRLGRKIGCVSWEGNLYSETIIHIDYAKEKSN